MTDHEAKAEKRAAAVERVAIKLYRARAPKDGPEWEQVPPMHRYAFMEAANKVINDVLEEFAPAGPDVQALAFQFEMVAAELEDQHRHGVVVLQTLGVASLIRQTLKLVDYGEAKDG